MGKIYCLIGKSASGKSTIERELEKCGIKRIISTTTRDIREQEQEGVDYHYITENEFKQLQKNNTLLEDTTYRNWHYGIDANYNNLDLKKYNYICVIEPHGYEQLLKSFNKSNIVSIYVNCDDKNRLLRSLNREINPNCQEICRRFTSDIELFKGYEQKLDYVIQNNNDVDLKIAVKKIYKIITGKEYCNITEDLEVGDKVKVIDILDKDKASHLLDFKNKEGFIFSWIVVGKEKRYKVLFDDKDNTAYFRREELQRIE